MRRVNSRTIKTSFSRGSSVLLMILVVALMFALSSGTAGAVSSPSEKIFLEKSTVFAGEIIIISLALDDFSEKEISISFGDQSYKYLGQLEDSMKFIPRKTGAHLITLSDAVTEKEIDSIFFTAISPDNVLGPENSGSSIETSADEEQGSTNNGDDENNPQEILSGTILTTEKDRYLVGETVVVAINTEISSEHSISIIHGTNKFNYLGTLENTISYIPAREGVYKIDLGLNNETIASVSFTAAKTFSPVKGDADSSQSDIQDTSGQWGLENLTFDIGTVDSGFDAEITVLKKRTKVTKHEVNPGLFRLRELMTLSKDNEVVTEEEFYDIELNFDDSPLEKMSFRDLKIQDSQGRIGLGVDEIQKNDFKKFPRLSPNKPWNKMFAIDPSSLDFTNATATITATGTELYKCKDWNFDSQTCEGTWVKLMDLIPGQKYNLTLTPLDPGFAETGVASINTKKPIYHPGETVEIIIVVLDIYGSLVSNASVELEIISLSNVSTFYSTADGTITQSGRGIYETSHFAGSEGEYSLTVSAVGANVNSSMSSYFLVQNYYEFDILRTVPVTIDPWDGPFSSSINVISYADAENFSLTESLPLNFTITDAGGGYISQSHLGKFITWYGLSNNSQVSYSAQTPLITPDLHELGLAEIEWSGGSFQEARTWYLAIDPLSQLNATGCNKMQGATADNTFGTACDNPWNIDDEDTNYQSASSSRNKYCGFQTTHDDSLARCVSVDTVEVCIDWYFTVQNDVKTCTGVSYSTTGIGGTFTPISGSTCPDVDGAVQCYDVSSASWTCSSFSSANAAIRASLRADATGDCRADTIYYYVNYTSYPNITSTVINTGPVTEGDDITFTGTCLDSDAGDVVQLIVCNSSASTCDNTTTGADLICKGSFMSGTSPTCTYTTSPSVAGNHTGDKANCCDDEHNCDTATVSVNMWQVDTLAGTPIININDVEGDTEPDYIFTDETPVVNATNNRDGYCYLSEFDESFSDMVANGSRVNCGFYTKDVSKDCTYNISLPIGLGTDNLFLSCNNTAGGETDNLSNADIPIKVQCDTHGDCDTDRYCDSLQQCTTDQLPGYVCDEMAYELGDDNQVCQIGGGATAICINDSSYSYTGWYCAADSNDCVYDEVGYSYDENFILCTGNDYKQCGDSNTWGDWVECANQFDPYDPSATASAHIGEYCGYYADAQACDDGDADLGTFGCNGTTTDCGNYLYNQTTDSCGSLLGHCDVGCGASCDVDNSTTSGIAGALCYYDMSCSGACAWSENTEDAPTFCINDYDGGACAYTDRVNPSSAETCYFDVTCVDIFGANMSSTGMLRANYCDFCNATGNQNGDYSPAPNSSCTSDCANSGTVYYDSGGTPGVRTDDCSAGTSTVLTDSLALGDVWNGTALAYCDDTECDSDCGAFLDGACLAGACACEDNNNPSVVAIIPVNDTWQNSSDVFLYYNVTDLGSAIDNCSLHINSALTNTTYAPAEDTLLDFSSEFNNGSFTWRVDCYDNSIDKNYNTTETRVYGVDTSFPSLSDANRNASAFDINQYICLNVTVSDTYSGLDTVKALIERPGGNPPVNVTLSDSVTTSCDASNDNYVYSVEYLLDFSGTYNWTYAFGKDYAENEKEFSVVLKWDVTAGGTINATMPNPDSDFTLNESDFNNYYFQNCSVECVDTGINCTDVDLFVEYDAGPGFADVNTSTEPLAADYDVYSCGNLTSGDTACSFEFNVSAGENTGGNIWPVRCKATSSNSATSVSEGVNATVNNNPVSVIDYPVPSQWLTRGVEINASSSTDSDGSIVRYIYEYDDNTLFSSPATICDSAQETCTWNTTIQTQCVNNSLACYLRVTVRDDGGLTNSTYILTGFDTQGPTVSLDEPENSAYINSELYAVNATSSDAESGTDDVFFEYRQNASGSWNSICDDDSEPYSCTWNLTLLPDGEEYEVRVYANDSLNNYGNTDTHTALIVDRTAPQVYLEQPQTHYNTSDSLIAFYYNATDTTADIDNCSLYVDGLLRITNSSVVENETSVLLWSLSETTHTWFVTCFDEYGYSTTTGNRNLTVDQTGPTVNIGNPGANTNISGVSYTVTATASDPGINQVEAVVFQYRNGSDAWTNICADTSFPYSCSWTLAGLSDSTDYQVRAYGNDTLGNYGLNDTHTGVTLDNAGPTITLVSPEPGATDGDGSVEFEFSVTDIISPIENCSLYINGIYNQSIFAPLVKGTVYEFNNTNMSNGDYSWNVTCWDSYTPTHLNGSETRSFTIDIRYEMGVYVYAESTYELGNQEAEDILVLTNTTDFYNNALDTYVRTQIISGITTFPWWNTSWGRRQSVRITEELSQDRTNVIIRQNITGLEGNISSCVNEIRVASVNLTEVPVNIITGDNSKYCEITFLANITASANNETLYFVYYNNSGASSPGYSTLYGKHYNLFFDDFATGTNPDVAKWTETGTYWAVASGRANLAGSKGYNFITTLASLIDLSDFDSGNITFDWEVTDTIDGEECVRLDVYDGSWADAVWQKCGAGLPLSGTKSYNLADNYLLSSFQLRYGGDTSSTPEILYLDNVNVSGYKIADLNLSSSTGDEQVLMGAYSTDTGADGFISYLFHLFGAAYTNYSAVSLGTRPLYADTYASSTFEFVEDATAPNITLVSPPNGSDSNSSVTFTYRVNDTLSEVMNCSLYVDGNLDDNDTFVTEGDINPFYPRIPTAGWHNWSVNCTDYYGNEGESEMRTVFIRPPDISVNYTNISFSDNEPLETQNITISAMVSNVGGSDALNVIGQIYLGDPDSGGVQLGDNFTFNITDSSGGSSTYNMSVWWLVVGPGPFTFFAVVDPPLSSNGSIQEIYEYNNKANKTLNVGAWTTYYGNVLQNTLLDLATNETLMAWSNSTNATGNLYFVDSDASISWYSLSALTRNLSGDLVMDDIGELDSSLNMTNYNDSINFTYTAGGSLKNTSIFTIYHTGINDVPVINSTTTSDFLTGILWDSADLNDGEFNGSQDVVFVTEVAQDAQGAYGVYDYELRLPVMLRQHVQPSVKNNIMIYTELN